MATAKELNAGAMPQLTDFAISYCALTEHVLLHANSQTLWLLSHHGRRCNSLIKRSACSVDKLKISWMN